MIRKVIKQIPYFCLKANRLSDFYIRVGNVFEEGSFDPTTYTLCHYQPTALFAGETRLFQCPSPIAGRFVTIHFPIDRTNVSFTLRSNSTGTESQCNRYGYSLPFFYLNFAITLLFRNFLFKTHLLLVTIYCLM